MIFIYYIGRLCLNEIFIQTRVFFIFKLLVYINHFYTSYDTYAQLSLEFIFITLGDRYHLDCLMAIESVITPTCG
jgi:hypothetical protein